ncbi:uncharacterized protein LOC129771000 [Toxorhynchites rutilus septentrionalis]|uniref:uncharacterized protein LOC129771000 n=1 Tax=Toxorhynchites rutilus septentrionalis TaxID=329112 RepID=UPI00247AC0A9|nr:uncharacterized protein LOC129771000 [Toxorhynchites rutilus septentrionalis]
MVCKIITLALIALSAVGCDALEVISSSSSLGSSVNCTKPPSSMNISSCCHVPVLITPVNLSTCNKTHTQWLAGGKKTGMCGSRCILSQLTDGLNSTMNSPLATLDRVTLYMNALSSCIVGTNYDQFVDKLMKNTTNLLDAVCNIDLLSTADCFGRNLLLACSTVNRTSICVNEIDYLNTPCPYSGLVSE